MDLLKSIGTQDDPVVDFGLKNQTGDLVMKHQVTLSELSF